MSLQQAIDNIHKQFGEDSIRKMGSKPKEIESISTGSIPLNKAIGVGGLPKGRVIEIFGPESSGKTTLCLHCIAEAQKMGGIAAFIDVENALDTRYAANIGVNVDELLISQPDCGEEALEIVDTLVRSNEVSIIVVDSVAALVPKAEIEGEMGQSHMGLQARLMSQAMRKLSTIISKTNCVVIFTNQIRMKIGILYGNPETTTGGEALKYYASIRLDIRKKEKIIESGNVVGNNVHIKVVKNKVAAPFKEIDTCIMYGIGIFKEGEILEYYINEGLIEKAGSWFKYKDEKIQGYDNMINFIKIHINEFQIQ